MAKKPNSSHKRRRLLFMLIAVLFLVAVAGSCALRLKHGQTTSLFGPKLLLEVKDSGSTNLKGWDLLIYDNGSGQRGSQSFAAGTFDASALKQALSTTDLRNFQDTCERSASFGSIETLLYNHTSTKGIDCYLDAQSNTPLGMELKAAITKAGL